MREARSASVKYRATQSHAEKVKKLAEEQGCSVSDVVFMAILEHFQERLETETDPGRIAGIQRALDSAKGRLHRAPKAVVRDYIPGGFVYFVRCGQFYKIGRAKNIKQRFAGLQFSEKPRLIKAVHCIDYGSLEKALHALFAHKRTHGEWFELSESEVLQAKQYMEARVSS